MQFSMSVRQASATILILSATLSAGCQTDRETALVGKWKGDRMSATFAATRMKEESGASTEQAKEAAKILAATFVEIRKDKTFTAGMGGATTEGSWTFNKESGEVVLNIAKMKGPDGKEMEGAAGAWTAYLGDNNQRLAFYPAPPESVAMIRKSGSKEGLANGVSLYKK